MPKAWPLLFALLLAGCGGGSSATLLEGSTGTVAATFSSATGFNGNTGALTTYTNLDGSVNGNTLTITVQNGDRVLQTSLISTTLAAGTSIDLSGTTGSVVTYSDTNGTWDASSGVVTILTHSASTVTVQLTNVVLTNSSSTATGSVTLSGTVTFISG